MPVASTNVARSRSGQVASHRSSVSRSSRSLLSREGPCGRRAETVRAGTLRQDEEPCRNSRRTALRLEQASRTMGRTRRSPWTTPSTRDHSTAQADEPRRYHASHDPMGASAGRRPCRVAPARGSAPDERRPRHRCLRDEPRRRLVEARAGRGRVGRREPLRRVSGDRAPPGLVADNRRPLRIRTAPAPVPDSQSRVTRPARPGQPGATVPE